MPFNASDPSVTFRILAASVELFLFTFLALKVLASSYIALKRKQTMNSPFWFYVAFIALQLVAILLDLRILTINPVVNYNKGLTFYNIFGDTVDYLKNAIFASSFLFLGFYCFAVEEKLSIDRLTCNLQANKKLSDFRAKVAYITFILFTLLQTVFTTSYSILLVSAYFNENILLLPLLVLMLFNIWIQILCGSVSKPKCLILWRNYTLFTILMLATNAYVYAFLIRMPDELKRGLFQAIFMIVSRSLQLVALARAVFTFQDIRSQMYVNRAL